MRIRNPGWGDTSDPGWKKVGFGIRDKHPGSATVVARYLVVLFPVLGEHGPGPEDLTAVRTAPSSDPAPAPRTTLMRLRRWW
jgi:hypothetical protein